MLVSAACGNKSTTNVVTSNEIATPSSNYDLYYYYYYKGFLFRTNGWIKTALTFSVVFYVIPNNVRLKHL